MTFGSEMNGKWNDIDEQNIHSREIILCKFAPKDFLDKDLLISRYDMVLICEKI
jgi:hypothetical protein